MWDENTDLPTQNPDTESRLSSVIDTHGHNLKDYLFSTIDKYGLSESYEKNQIGSLARAYIYEVFQQRSHQNNRVTVYYPGIGGGDQPFDILGAFINTDADEVYGVDLLDGREDIRDFHRWATLAMGKLPENGNSSFKETDDEWAVEFNLYDKRRKLRVSKHPTDVSTYKGNPYISSDQTIGPLVYSRGTATLLNSMAPEMEARVEALVVSDDYDLLVQSVQEYWQQKGFVTIDFKEFVDLMKEKYSLSGDFPLYRKRLLVKK